MAGQQTVTGARRRARAYALQLLYAADVGELASVAAAADRYWSEFELELGPEALAFGTALAVDAASHRAELDDIVQRASTNWRIERMSQVDRNILRLGAFELRYSRDVPVKVIINEAVELAKGFGAAESAAFVNGILDRIARELGR